MKMMAIFDDDALMTKIMTRKEIDHKLGLKSMELKYDERFVESIAQEMEVQRGVRAEVLRRREVQREVQREVRRQIEEQEEEKREVLRQMEVVGGFGSLKPITRTEQFDPLGERAVENAGW